MSVNDFWIVGHYFTKFKGRSIDVGMRKFRQLFGASPTTCSYIWGKLENSNSLPTNAHPIHLLYAMLFLKTYGTEELNSALATVTEKTFRKWYKIFVVLIAEDLDEVSSNNK
jgi:hypothetical protein